MENTKRRSNTLPLDIMGLRYMLEWWVLHNDVISCNMINRERVERKRLFVPLILAKQYCIPGILVHIALSYYYREEMCNKCGGQRSVQLLRGNVQRSLVQFSLV